MTNSSLKLSNIEHKKCYPENYSHGKVVNYVTYIRKNLIIGMNIIEK